VSNLPTRIRPSAIGAGSERWDLFLVCMAGWALVSITRTHAVLPVPESLRPGLLLAGLSLLLYFVQRDPARRFGVVRHPLIWIAGFFFVWALVTAPFALYIGKAVSYILGTFIRSLLFFLLLALCLRSVKDASRMANVLGMGAVIFAVGALGSAFRGVRIGGLDPNDSAMLLAAMLPLILFAAIRARSVLLKWVYGIGFLVCAAAIVHTGSRGGFLALAAVVVYTVVIMRPVRPAVRALVAVAVVAGAIGTASGDYWERVRSIAELDDGYSHGDIGGRKNTWNRGLEYAAANPITGVGINNFTVAEARHPIIAGIIASGRGMKFSAPHSIWVQVGAELGAPGFLAFVAMFFVSMLSLFRLASRGARAPPGSRDRLAGELAAALLGSLIALAVGGSFLTHAYSPMLWGVFGLSVGLLKVARLPARGAPSAAVPVARWRPSVERPLAEAVAPL
jgi:putative inorganic carbon (hco3(-)) transporter